MKDTKPSYDGFIAKIEKLRREGGVDLTVAEDLSLAVMNLISLEEHFFFTGEKTGKGEYFDHAVDVRAMRKDLLEKLMPNHEGETWCASKHLLATAMRLIEVGNRYQKEGKKDEAKKYYDDAYKVYSIFWGLRLKLFDVKAVKGSEASDKPMTYEDLMKRLADCCNE